MIFTRILAVVISTLTLCISGCGGGSLEGGDYSSETPASAEPTYYGTPTDIPDNQAVTVTIPAYFLYRGLSFTPGSPTNGLSSVVPKENGLPIAFAEFHIYDAGGNRIQQGETDTTGKAIFELPKTAGTYTLKVFSRAFNSYLKVSVLSDLYGNIPHSIAKTFSLNQTDLTAGTKDLTSDPVYAEADETVSANIEGGAFNIMYDILLANEYIRRNINKNTKTGDVPSSNANEWWVADKVTVYWRAGFNPYSYFGYSTPLSFYSPGDRKLFILGGVNGDVKSSDTDHFDDSVILHEYGHFLEDVYGNSGSPGGSHNGNFVIDARLAWSEGWANYFQGAVLTGADAVYNSASENREPTTARYHYYVDTYGYKGSGNSAGVSIAFNLWEDGTSAALDATGSDVAATGNFREVSISRTLYKSTRATTADYVASTKYGGGVDFSEIWKTFSGEDTSGHNRSNPVTTSLGNTTTYPVPSAGLFHYLLNQNVTPDAKWNSILTEEKQSINSQHYAYYLGGTSCSATTFTNGTTEQPMYAGDPANHSHQQVNNDFYLYYHDGSSTTLAMTYTSTELNLDLILYYKDYVYFEDTYWYAGHSSPYIAKQSRSATGTSESISLAGLPAGYYILNVKINAYNKLSSQLDSSASYSLTKNGSPICGTER